MRKALLISAFAAVCLCAVAAAQDSPKRYAVVDLSVSYLRQSPDYESPLETQELMGTVVEIVGESAYWRQVVSPQPYTAWCTDRGLVEMDEAQLAEYEASSKYVCVAPLSSVLSSPSKDSQPLSDLVMGDVLRKPEGRGSAKKGFLKVVLPDGREGWTPKSALMDMESWRKSCEENLSSGRFAEKAVALARRFVGTPYLWGGMSPKGFDCSGLVRMCYLMNGITLPRNASQMVRLGEDVPLDALQPGDLLFFGRRDADGTEHVTHVGMYVGDGHFIHSSHLVRVNSMRRGDSDCYENIHKLLRARRYL